MTMNYIESTEKEILIAGSTNMMILLISRKHLTTIYTMSLPDSQTICNFRQPLMAHFQSFALNAPTVHRHLKMSMTYNVTQKLFILTTQEKENTVESLKAIHKK